MNFVRLEPEVAGQLGPKTEGNFSVHPPVVTRLHYSMDGWLGDPILESFPCFIVTDDARASLQAAGSSGVYFSDVEITASEVLLALQPQARLPGFSWLRVVGKAFEDDFGLDSSGMLVVSDRALRLLEELGMMNAAIEHLQSPIGEG